MEKDEDSAFYKMGKMLTHVDKEKRDEAVKLIQKNVCSIKKTTEINMMKLWKGLFYTFWMSDKPAVQEELADTLANFIPKFSNEEMADLYVHCFWVTIYREWGGIDKLRMDKYCYLVRRILREGLVKLKTNQYKSEEIKKFMDDLFQEFFYKEGTGCAILITYSFMNELATSNPKISNTIFIKFAVCFIELMEDTKISPVVTRSIATNIFKSLLTDFETLPTKTASSPETSLILVDLHSLLDIFKEHAMSATLKLPKAKRTVLYALMKNYQYHFDQQDNE
ncbi:hypothetical protein WA158_003559 [Blastocystis sp. Blastoise]